MSRQTLAQIIWWETDVPVFLEKVILPALVTAITIVVFLNPMKFDLLSRSLLFMGALAFAGLISHQLHLRNEAIRLNRLHPSGAENPTQRPNAASPTVNQQATDSTCSNVSAGKDATVNCSPSTESKDAPKSSPSP